ncbi:MAG TPA: amidase [Candidatus Limnocylindrales bacterium]|nr:amidase [Candidatus Limnocylindrales bacterium]
MTPHSESELAFLTIEAAARLLRRGEILSAELIEAALRRIERLNPSLNAFISVSADAARRQARAADRELRRKRGSLALGPLHGIPISLKDNYCTRGIRTTAGSRILENFIPQGDAEAAARLARAGAVLLGKTNMHEFAYGITNENPHYGPVRNPWNRECMTGGSSGGSAAALTAGIGLGATGTDTGGSIRIPSGLCGVVGLKPTFGLVSVAGIIPLAETFDHAGPMARTVTDTCILLEAMAGEYPRGAVRPNFRNLRKIRPRKFRLGWPKEYFFERVDAEVKQAVEAAIKCLESLGGRIVPISVPHLSESVEPSTNIAMAEATHYHLSMGYFPAHEELYGEDVRKRLQLGIDVRAVDYLRALGMKREIAKNFDAAFERVDLIVAPALPVAAPRLGTKEMEIAGEKETVRSAFVRLNRPANFTGHPAISVPCGITRAGLPIGLQLIGPYWGEARLLAIALGYEEATEWHNRHPNLD